MKCPECGTNLIPPQAILIEMMSVDTDADMMFKIVGFINNCEFHFYTNKKGTYWWFEMSLNPFVSIDVVEKGDGVYFGKHGEWSFEEDISEKWCKNLIGHIANEVVLEYMKRNVPSDVPADETKKEIADGGQE